MYSSLFCLRAFDKYFIRNYATGVSILEGESKDGRVTMELEMQWDGNPKIKLDIKTRVGLGIPVQVTFGLPLTIINSPKRLNPSIY